MTADQIQSLLADAERASSTANRACYDINAVKARLTIALREAEGRPLSRDARLSRALLAEPFDHDLYRAIAAEPFDEPLPDGPTTAAVSTLAECASPTLEAERAAIEGATPARQMIAKLARGLEEAKS